MIFESVDPVEAEGSVLAHSARCGDVVIRKGTLLSASHIDDLCAAKVGKISVATSEPGDIGEDEAAALLAEALCGPNLNVGKAATGRANLHAADTGLLLVERERVHRINMIDERITVATLPQFETAATGQLTATIKIITYFVPSHVLDRALAIAEARGPVLSLRSYRSRQAAFIGTELGAQVRSLTDKGLRATRKRLEKFESKVTSDVRVPHAVGDLAAALRQKRSENPDLILILGATAIADRADVVPAALLEAGGSIDQFGMPVDPGNLLLLGQLDGIDVVGIPGCARSPSFNGFDLVLQRLHADIPITSRDFARMGVGGLLKEIPSRPQPRELLSRDGNEVENKQVYAIVLAAGQSRRMGNANKLLEPLHEKPLVNHVVDNLKRSRVRRVLVVTGHERDKVEASLADCDVEFVHNPDYSEGLSSSLKAGVSALPGDADGVLVCLGDMPLISDDQIDEMISAWLTAPSDTICLPSYRGKTGNPVLWPSLYFIEIMDLEGDVGGRALIGKHSDSVLTIETNSDSVLIDVDTPAILRDLEAKH